MNMRRTPVIGNNRVGPRLYGPVTIVSFRVRRDICIAVKVGIDCCRIAVMRMRVAPGAVGLPDFQAHAGTRVTAQVQYPAGHIDDFALRLSGAALEPREINASVRRLLYRIEGAKNLIGRRHRSVEVQTSNALLFCRNSLREEADCSEGKRDL